jgi:hypothetical protein
MRLLPCAARCVLRARDASKPIYRPAALIATRSFTSNMKRETSTPLDAPPADKASRATAFLGTQKRLPEFNLTDKVVIVSGAARGLGLTQAQALLEAGAIGTDLPASRI